MIKTLIRYTSLATVLLVFNGFTGIQLSAEQATASYTLKKFMNCDIVRDEVGYALEAHLIHKQLTPELIDVIRGEYISSINKGTIVLLSSDRAQIKSIVEKLTTKELRAALGSGSCGSIIPIQKIISDAYNRFESSFLPIDSLRRSLMSTEPETQEYYEAARNGSDAVFDSIDSLRSSHFDSLMFQVGFFSSEATREQSVLHVSKKFERNLLELKAESEVLSVEALLSAFFNSLDAHSNLLNKEQSEQMGLSLSSGYAGLGVQIQESAYGVKLLKIFPWSPLKNISGIAEGDLITSVDGQSLEGLSADESKKLIIGKPETIISILVGKINEKKNFEQKGLFNVTRKQLLATQVDGHLKSKRITFQGSDVISIEIGSFYDGLSRDVEDLIGGEKKNGGFRALVLDLRNNPGGRATEAVGLVSLFIKSGPVLRFNEQGDGIRTFSDEDGLAFYDGPLVVAINRGSASASEIVSGALKDYKRAIIVGDDQTFGKGTAQNIMPIVIGGGLFRSPQITPYAKAITMAQFFLPAGESTQSNGVTSDIVIQDRETIKHPKESEMPHALGATNLGRPLYKPEELAQNRDSEIEIAMALSKQQSLARRGAAADPGEPLSFNAQSIETYLIAHDFALAHKNQVVFSEVKSGGLANSINPNEPDAYKKLLEKFLDRK